MNCYDCVHLGYKPDKSLGFVSKVPYCKIGVTNNRDDPNQKDGKCTKFKVLKDKTLTYNGGK